MNREARTELSENLRLLVNGELTNDQFDELYYSRWEQSDDAAVRAIGQFGYCLYSSDVLLPYKLTGRHAVSETVRNVADRAMLFLTTDLEYSWPKEAFRRDYSGICKVCFFSLSAVGLLILIAGRRIPDFPWEIGSVIAGVVAMFAVLWFANFRLQSKHERLVKNLGDWDVWPFLRDVDYEDSRPSHN